MQTGNYAYVPSKLPWHERKLDALLFSAKDRRQSWRFLNLKTAGVVAELGPSTNGRLLARALSLAHLRRMAEEVSPGHGKAILREQVRYWRFVHFKEPRETGLAAMLRSIAEGRTAEDAASLCEHELPTRKRPLASPFAHALSARLLGGTSQREAAELSGIGIGTLSRWEQMLVAELREIVWRLNPVAECSLELVAQWLFRPREAPATRDVEPIEADFPCSTSPVQIACRVGPDGELVGTSECLPFVSDRRYFVVDYPDGSKGLLHRLAWIQAYAKPVPVGCELHHAGDVADQSVERLRALPRWLHFLVHQGEVH